MNARETSHIRELFIHELAQVNGGGPVEELIQKLRDGSHSTEACCEEGPAGCCDWLRPV